MLKIKRKTKKEKKLKSSIVFSSISFHPVHVLFIFFLKKSNHVFVVVYFYLVAPRKICIIQEAITNKHHSIYHFSYCALIFFHKKIRNYFLFTLVLVNIIYIAVNEMKKKWTLPNNFVSSLLLVSCERYLAQYSHKRFYDRSIDYVNNICLASFVIFC